MRVFGRGHWLNLRLTLRNSGQIFVWRRRVRWLAGSGLRRTGSDSAGVAAVPARVTFWLLPLLPVSPDPTLHRSWCSGLPRSFRRESWSACRNRGGGC